jgi:hypothetical protein
MGGVMAELLEKLSSGLLKILDLFKKPELIKPVDEGVEVEDKTDLHLRLNGEFSDESKALDEKEDFPQTLGELLDNLDFTFDAYKMKSFTSSWLDAGSRAGLKRLGAHVPNPWQTIWYDNVDNLKVDTSKGMPAIIFVSTPHKKKKDAVHPAYMFAIKGKKLPWYIQHKEGTPYQFGMAFADNKLFWHCAWLVVKKDGSFEYCKERRHDSVVVKSKGKVRAEYTKFVLAKPTMIEEYNSDEKNGELIMKNSFKAIFDWWVNRNERWSVAVKKGDERVTFCVDKSLTKKYFADREKTAVTITGQKKKIIHYVKAHERMYEEGKKTVVKEHIRGVNTFDWKAYKCLVSAPEFGMTLTSTFNVASVQEEDEKPTEKLIPLSQVGTLLAKFEERNAQR